MDNEKKSLWTRFKSFIKKVMPGKKTLAIGAAAASMMAANIDKADAAELRVDLNEGNRTVDTVKENVTSNPLRVSLSDSQNPTVTVEKSSLERFADNVKATKNTINTVRNGIGSIENVASSIENLGKSSNIGNVISNTENTIRRTETATQKVNESEQAVSQLLQVNQARKKMLEDKGYTDGAKTLQKNIDNLQSQIQVTENQETVEKATTSNVENITKTEKVKPAIDNSKLERNEFSHINFNPFDKENALSNKIVDLKVQASQAKYNNDMELYNQLTSEIKSLEAERIKMTEARINDGVIPDVADDSAEFQSRDVSPEKFEKLTAFTNLSPEWTSGEKLAVLSNGLTDLKLAISDCKKNGDQITAQKLVEVYNKAMVQRYELAVEASKNPSSPANELKMPDSYHSYIARTVHSKTTKSKNIKNPEYKQETKKAVVSPYKVNDTSIDADSLVNSILNSNTPSTKIDETKLNDVSMGQMGVLEEDKKVNVKPTKSQINEEKLQNVSVGQMGTFEGIDLDAMIDEALNTRTAKSENKKEQKVIKTNDDKKETKTQKAKNVNPNKSDYIVGNNGEKININDIFNDIGINEQTFSKQDKSKDDGQER